MGFFLDSYLCYHIIRQIRESSKVYSGGKKRYWREYLILYFLGRARNYWKHIDKVYKKGCAHDQVENSPFFGHWPQKDKHGEKWEQVALVYLRGKQKKDECSISHAYHDVVRHVFFI